MGQSGGNLYGLVRPRRGEDLVYIHRQTTQRLALSPDPWEPISVDRDEFPDEILADMARLYGGIHEQWREISWWLGRVHHTAAMSAQPILSSSNYVVVTERGYETSGHRPHGLVELVFGRNSHAFATCFLAPITHSGHFGIQMMGLLNGDRLNRRLVRCYDGFFIHVTCYILCPPPFLWSELYQSAPLVADTLHTVEVYPVSERTRRSVPCLYCRRVFSHSQSPLSHSGSALQVRVDGRDSKAVP